MVGFDFCCISSAGMPLPFASDRPGVGGTGEFGPLLVPLTRLLGAVGTFFGRSEKGGSGAVPGRCLSVALSYASGICAISEALEAAELELYITKGFRPPSPAVVDSRPGGLELRALLLLAASSGPNLVVSRVL